MLGWLFKSDKNNLTSSNLTIVFELINEDDYTNNNFIVVVPLDNKKSQALEHQKRVSEILGYKN